LVDKQLGKGQPAIRTPSRDAGFTQRDRGIETLCQKLQELKELRSADLISQQEYELKKAEILDEF